MSNSPHNAKTAEYVPGRCIHELFEAQVERTPDAVAVVYEGESLRYRELNERANRLAHHLVELGVEPDTRVAIGVERSLEMVVGLLAILKAGAAYVPLDPTYPAERLSWVLSDSEPRALLTQSSLRGRWGQVPDEVTVIEMDAGVAPWEQLPSSNLETRALGLTSRHLAYVIYTSGSTGRPKGVEIEHGAVHNFLCSMKEAPGMSSDDVMLAVTTIAFDIAALELYLPLAVGARVIVASREMVISGEQLLGAIDAHRVTVMQGTPTTWRLLLAAGYPGQGPRMRALCGGEALPGDLAEALRAVVSELWNLYGPTETCIWSSRARIDGEEITLGRPIANTYFRVLDADGGLVPPGVAGELYIGGEGLARGYHGRQRLTAERFLPDEYGAPGERLYRTGDRVRYRPDGTLEYLGRLDQQVKVRGFRIELGEIETKLRELEGVQDAVVVVREDERGDKRLVAYCISGEELRLEWLRQQLARELPEYMVPSAYVRLSAWPLTPNGKLDRRALPAPEGDAYRSRAYEAPEGEVELGLAQIWSDLLGVERVGRHDHFFDLGGHSLLAVTMVSRTRTRFGVELPLSELFARPTLSEVASSIATSRRSSLPAITVAERTAPLPLSYAQQRLWFLAQMGEGVSQAYHIAGGVRLTGALNRAVLRAALDRIVERHEALRTTFGHRDGVPFQVIGPADSGFALIEQDRRGRPESELWQAAEEEVGTAFDLSRGPLIRGRLIELSETEHVLLVTMHHIVSDGWSMGVLVRELGELYRALAQGRPPALAELAIQYADYAVWQRQWLQGEVQKQQLGYWTKQLSGAPALLELPSDRARPAVQDYAGARIDVRLDAELTRGLRAMSQRHGTTLYMTLLAGWVALLSRLSGQDDVVIGTPVANRTRTEVEPLIGLFVNTLALRVDLSGAPTVAELQRQVKQRTLEAQSHQDVPFEQVVEAMHPARSLAHGPVFQVMFAWQNTPKKPLERAELGDLELEAFAPRRTTAQFDLTLSMHEEGDAIGGGLEYATALFEARTLERYIGYWKTLLRGMVADDGQRIGRLSLLSEGERRQVLEEWNATAAEYAPGRCIHELFEAQVERTPDAVAVVYEGESLRYRELNERANRLARHLVELGVEPDTRVAIGVERSLEMVVGLLAILKAGGAYVPLDPTYPAERLSWMLLDSDPRALLTQSSLRGRWGRVPDDVTVIEMDGSVAPWEELPSSNLETRALGPTSRHLAYVIYTSGSTGNPKGVMVEHANVTRLFEATASWFQFGPNDVWTLFHSFAFDFSVWEIWGALLHGGRLIVVSQPVTRSPGDFYRLLCHHGVTVLNQTPSAFRQLTAAQFGAGDHRLRVVIFGGEALDVAILEPWYAQNGGARTQLVNMYGITETTVHVTYRPLAPADTKYRGASPIGVRIPDLRAYILDEHRQPVGIGVTGELYIGGAGVARGYLNRPELTAERFVPDPFAPAKDGEPPARMYKTGDLGRWLADGSVEFIGRNDAQVKIRGFRIELGEIEARLRGIAGIREAVVRAREDEPGDKRLVAYYTSTEEVRPEWLRSQLAGELPEYMVPGAYVRMEAWPLTPNGKLDGKALPAPDTYGTRQYEAPEGVVEQTLAQIWSELLKVERVGRHDHFFELGGHSLLAVTLLERMRQHGLHADVRDLFATPALSELAMAVGRATPSTQVDVPANRIPEGCQRITPELLPLVELRQAEIDRIVETVPGGAANVQDIYPLAPLQEGVLFHYRIGREADVYQLCTVIGFDSRERLDVFVRALQSVVERHDILRTAMLWEGLPEPVQVVWRHASLPVEEVTLGEGDALSELRSRIDRRHRRIDVRRAPLLQACIAHDAARGRWLLGMMHHHLVDDATTVRFVVQEFQAHLLGVEHRLSKPRPFRDFVAQARLGVNRAEDEAFFRQMLVTVDEPTAPFGLVNVQGDGADIREARLPLEGALSRRLRAAARALGVSVASLCHVAWARVLGRLVGREDVVFGTVLFGRMRGGASADRVLGMFINTLPVRIAVGEESVEQAVRRTQELLAQMLHHEHTPLVVAQRCSGVRPPAPLFTSLLNYRYQTENASRSRRAWEGIELLHAEERTNYPLTVAVDDLGEGFWITTHVHESVDPMRVCEHMNTALEHLVEALERAPDTTMRSIEVLSEARSYELLEAWNATAVAYDDDKCLHQLFEEQVERTPGAVAVVYEGESLRYCELNEQANRLAHRLMALGVKPDTRVAIGVGRSLGMVVGLMAILKAGGAYVPLDPSYPPERLAWMLEDCAPLALLTHSSLKGRWGQVPDGVTIIELDGDLPSGEPPSSQFSSRNPEPSAIGVTSRHVAYVIYTSGSTGRPKGAMNEHRPVVNRLLWMQNAYGLNDRDAVLQKTSIGFDVSVWEVFWPLLTGAKLVVARPEGHKDPRYLTEVIRQYGITTMHFVPSMLRHFLEQDDVVECSSLIRIVCSGEALSLPLARRLHERLPWTALHNLYGPTEAAIDVTSWTSRPDYSGTSVPIGRPIANARMYVLDASQKPVPVGVPGELYIGGEVLARGYLNRPELTAERFVRDPFVDAAAGGRPPRMYKTGDVGRWLWDGNIEFLGRNDHQVKLRGFRIELEEIESGLMQHPSVREAVVTAHTDGDETRLTAYVIPRADIDTRGVSADGANAEEATDTWRAIWDATYEETEGVSEVDATFNIVGWNSSYTDAPMTEEEMRAWVEETTSRIAGLGPRNLLEIGCGTGLLLFRVAPRCARYVGVDFSESALRQIGAKLSPAGLTNTVALHALAADQIDALHAIYGTDEGGEPFDTIVVNSVVQYFPEVAYFVSVVEKAFGLLAPGGKMFVGDVRSLPLLSAFHHGVELHKAPATLGTTELAARIPRRAAREPELVIDPQLFLALKNTVPDLAAVEIHMKRDGHVNELTRFRYDVVLRKAAAEDDVPTEAALVVAPAGCSMDWMRGILRGNPPAVRIVGVPNARVRGEVHLVELLGRGEGGSSAEELRSKIEAHLGEGGEGVDPSAVFELDPAYEVFATWSAAGVDRFDVIARHRVTGPRSVVVAPLAAAVSGERPWSAYANVPARGDTPDMLAPELRAYLRERLPEYMLPNAYVRMDAWPLTPNGKLDRRALPVPGVAACGTRAYEAPVGDMEQALAELWSELLRVERVGRQDHFFELGGHSLLAVTLLERMRQRGLHADVRALFATPTLSGLAASIAGPTVQAKVEVPANRITEGCQRITPELLPLVELRQTEIDCIVETVPGGASNVQDIYPLAPLQEGVLFHHRISREGDAYQLCIVMGFDSRERLDSFVQALQWVIDRHDILRTAVVWEGLPEPVQVVWRRASMPVEEVMLAGGDALSELRARIDLRHHRIDVRRAPMIHSYIAQDGAQDRWLLGIVSHHLVNDHTTLELIVGEVRAHLEGVSYRLPEPRPFRDFVAQARLGVSREEHEAFFRQMLESVDEPTAPFGLVDVQGDGSGILEAGLTLQRGLSRRLRACARLRGVSAASLCHVAWARVLGCLVGREDVVFGTVLFGRMQAGASADRVLGMFINTLPVRIAVGEESVEQTVRKMQELLAQTLHHEHAPLALAQGCSGVRPPAPLFTSLLNYRYDQTEASRSGAAWEGMNLLYSEERTNFPLTMSVDDSGEGFRLTTYVHESIDPMRVCAYMHTALEHLVEALERAPHTAMRSIEVLGEAECRQVLHDWNATAAEYERDKCLHELFEAQVERTPDAVAVVYEGESLRYRELNERANRLAHRLLARGVKPDTRVAIGVERSLAMVVGLLGILKAGGAYVPLDPSYPPERLGWMLEDSAPRVLLTQSSLKGRWAEVPQGVTIIELDGGATDGDLADGEHLASQLSSRNPEPRALGLTPDHLAYVIYTSGSTGRPKGAMNEHRPVVNRLDWMQKAYGLNGEDAILQKTPIGFDVSVWEVFWPLLTGAKLVLARAEGHKDARYLTEVIRQYGITTTHFVPSMLRLFLEQDEAERCRSLVRVVSSGEALPLPLARRFHERLPWAALHNLYGPTEAAIDVTSWTSHPDHSGASAPIGKPIANARMYVLDASQQPVPVGVTGELYIGGEVLARGYLNQPELTAERFVRDPFVGAMPGNSPPRMYKTGDVGRWLADGNIEFIGRNDFQVKLRGFRIELGEIETKLREVDGIEDSVVEAREDERGDKRLVGYYTGSEELAPEWLRSRLARELPEYMVPSAYVRLSAWPLTPNGKLDRKALPAPETGSYGTRAYEAPEGAVEQALAELWSELLKAERVGRHDHFFELGGHSLLAVTLLERMRQQGLHADVRALFTTPTLSALAATVEAATSPAWLEAPPNRIPADCDHITPEMLPLVELTQAEIACIVETVPGGASNVQDIYPLAPLQEGFLVHHRISREGDAYQLCTILGLDSRERVDAFLQTLQSVVDRHDILRTAIVWEGLPEPVQVVWRRTSVPVEEVTLDGGDALSQLRSRLDRRHLRIDVRRAPLIQVCIAQERESEVGRGRWLLGLVHHHLVDDITSLNFVIGELQAHLLGVAHRLPEPRPFRDFVAQARLGVRQEEHEAFFRQMLATVDAPTAPFDLVNVHGDGSDIREARLRVDGAVSQRLRACARAMGVSAASLHHLAWARVLGCLSGRDDVVFGTVLFGRMQGGANADRVLGMFINTLPVRIAVGRESVEQALRKTQELLAQMLHHEHAPLALAQRCSGVRPPAPLFTSLLNYRHDQTEDTSRFAGAWDGLEILYSEERTNYPLTMSVDDLGEGFRLTSHVHESIDPMRVCAYMRTALEYLVEALERAPKTAIRSIEVLGKAQRHELLHEWNATAADYGRDKCIHELFEEQVERTPDAVAVVYEGESLRYRELNERANRLAHRLLALGVKPDTRVAIGVERSLAMVVGLLGILKAGGAYVPLDPSYPPERLGWMLEDSAPLALLTQSSLKGRWAKVPEAVTVIDLDDEVAGREQLSTRNPERRALGLTSDHLAYVIYTSGSTGRPKGVEIAHGAVHNFLCSMKEAPGMGADDVLLAVTTVSFDIAVLELYLPLSVGACVVLASRETTMSGEKLLEAMEAHGVTVIQGTPTTWRLLLAAGYPGKGRRVRALCGGEALPHDLADALRAVVPELWNLYGPTETCVWSSRARIEGGAITLGSPLANTYFRVLDADGGLVPPGVAGELSIGGEGLARGYRGQAALTAERFVPDGYGEAGQRLYRTGDLVRHRSDGTLEYLGRLDHQVKIRGFRIELGEIESVLAQHPAVREAAVVARTDGGESRLVAYVLAKKDTETRVVNGEDAAATRAAVWDTDRLAPQLRAYLREKLPEHMMPVAYVTLPAWPLTPNGKLDRKALPAPEGDAYESSVYEAPEGEVEQGLAEIWSGLLHIARVGRRDHFFELGGHSLLAVTMVSRIRTRFGVELPLSELFARATLSEIASSIETGKKSSLPAITVAECTGPLPLSYAQQRLWFLAQLSEGASRAYHIAGGVRLTGELNRVALRAALNRIVLRHEVLRTTFDQKDGVPFQTIGSPSESGFVLVEQDRTGFSESELVRVSEDQAASPFDLSSGPLIHGRLIRLSEREHVLLVTMHHIVSDGWSIGVFVRELGELYEAFARGVPSALPELRIQYADYAIWQRRWLDGEVLQRQLDYWTRQLSGAPALLELPADRVRPALQDYAGAQMEVRLDAELTKGLRAMSQRHGTTLYMTLLAGWAALLSRLSGQDDIVIGTPTANRTRTEVEPLIGFFVNTLAMRIDLSGSPTVSELQRRVRRVALAAQSHQDVPFEQVVEAVRPARSLAHGPLFQVMFAWQNTPGARMKMENLELEAVPSPRATAQFDLMLSLHLTGDAVGGELEYATALFDRSTIERYVGYWKSLLEAMVADDSRRVDRLSLLSEAERRQVLHDWNATAAEYERDKCLHELFEAQVERTPDAVAVVYEGESLRYRELNERANRLAHRLLARGVKPDTRVAIGVERSLAMVVGLLGILKAGGAYVPLDPSYPPERLGWMLEDSAPRVLLTQSSLKGRWAEVPQGVTIIELDGGATDGDLADGEHLASQLSSRNPEPRALGLTPDHLAYVIYTSGSTGRPKGAMNEHRPVVNRLDWMQKAYGLNGEDAILQKTPIGFDVSVWEVFWPLLTGAKLVLARAEGHKDARYLTEVIRQYGITTTHFVPSMLRLFLEQDEAERCRSLVRVVSSGEALPLPLARRFHERLPWAALHNLYGPTEAAIDVTSWTSHPDHSGASAPIGKPIANARMYVLDASQQPVPVGVTGELYIGGEVLARGYLNQPELTAERFVRDPFVGAMPGNSPPRMYKTGDVGRWLADGNIEFIGRNDFQVKLRGFRIELGEIETKLREVDGIEDSVVEAREDERGDKRLVGYYTGSEELAPEWLRSRLARELPEYMVPSAYVRLSAWPLTPNGKLDRKALPAPETGSYGTRAYEAPEGAVEQALAELWSELLKAERVGRHDHFFELGGHSLLAVTLLERMRQQGLHADVRALFTTPTLSALAATVEAATSPAWLEAPPNRIPKDASDEDAPEMFETEI